MNTLVGGFFRLLEGRDEMKTESAGWTEQTMQSSE